MSFQCQNELSARGASEEELGRIGLLLGDAERTEAAAPGAAAFRFHTEDDTGEGLARAIAERFDGIGVSVLYISRDGGFLGRLDIAGGRESSVEADIEETEEAELERGWKGRDLEWARLRAGELAT